MQKPLKMIFKPSKRRMMKKILSLVLMMMTLGAMAQQSFLSSGRIEFERKINVHKNMEGEWNEQFKARIPKFKTNYFDLLFTPDKSLYKPGREPDVPYRFWDAPAGENTVFTDFVNQVYASQKQVYDQTFLVKDSLRRLEWKISNETRVIAGFECRKAVARMMDSVYIVAFYTDEITVSGGPESFSGLPGMILGLAVPRLYTTWFATKVELAVKENEIVTPAKGKKIAPNELEKVMVDRMKDWGKTATRFVWGIML
jgi:GLPGLI family protein